MRNTLYYGDNLDVLRKLPSESVDLIYLDPPFNSKRNYNVIFSEKSGIASPAQVEAFTDTWAWGQTAEEAIYELTTQAPAKVSRFTVAMQDVLGDDPLMAYLTVMAQRLVELHRVLKPTGSLYLHCDPTASHYLKTLLDTVFGTRNFRNEIVWHYNTGGKGKRYFLRKHDIILWYSKTDDYVFERDAVALPRKLGTAHLRHGIDEDGREYYEDYSPRKSGKQYRWYLDEGVTPMDVWIDIQALNPAAKERLGYQTQKPLALLERIVQASSRPGDVVLDPFCGCGTAIAAAERLGRKWIGIDITYLAIAVMEQRFRAHFAEPLDYVVEGIPTDVTSARALFEQSPYQFQYWAVDKLGINARPRENKGRDRGIDGEFFYTDDRGMPVRGIVQVKGGHTGSRDIRDFRGTMERERVELGIFVCMQTPTRDMLSDAARAGVIASGFTGRKHPRIQIITVAELFDDRRVDIPHMQTAHQKAPRLRRPQDEPQAAPLDLLYSESAGSEASN